MEWMAVIGNSIRYIEGHITDGLSINEIANAVNISPFYFQKGFVMLCGAPAGKCSRGTGCSARLVQPSCCRQNKRQLLP